MNPVSNVQHRADDIQFRKRRSALVVIFCAGALGVGIRAWLIFLSPASPDYLDHHEFVMWGNQAVNQGWRTFYVDPPSPARIIKPGDGTPITLHHDVGSVSNYPPLAMYLMAAQGRIHHAADPEQVSNTFIARWVYGGLALLCDLLVACGCYAVVRAWASKWHAAIVFAVVILEPSLMTVSALWGQVDSWCLAPMVWAVWAVVRSKWKTAGALTGVALMVKPQALMLGAVWAWVMLARKQYRPCAVGLGTTLLVVVLLAIPFIAASGGDWLNESYLQNLKFGGQFTTLKAFNLWYVDLLLTSGSKASDMLGPISKAAWGRTILLIGVVATSALIWHRYGRRRRGIVVWAAAVMLLAVLLPTGVRDRYLLVALPFVICTASLVRRMWLPAAVFIAVIFAQVTPSYWLQIEANTWERFAYKTEQDYQTVLAHTPPDQRSQVPPPSVILDRARPTYDQERRQEWDVYQEWTLTIIEILGGVLFVLLAAWPTNARRRSAGRRAPNRL